MIALIAGMLALAPCPPRHRTPPRSAHDPHTWARASAPKVLTLPPRRRRGNAAAEGSVAHCIRFAARRWNVSESMLRRKAWCESRMNPPRLEPSPAPSGLFQFLPGNVGVDTVRPPVRLVATVERARGGVDAHSVGRGNEWVCQ